MSDYSQLRRRMVEHQLVRRSIRDPLVLKAFEAVPREAFVPTGLAVSAYDDLPLPIGEGQTISQPYVVALMVEALELTGGETVLEIGTGSGYAAAILAHLARHVYSVERQRGLASEARSRLERLGYDRVSVRHGDGTLGWPEHAPYDGIIVSAGGPTVPPALSEQLAHGGRLVMPVGDRLTMQRLLRLRRLDDEEFEREGLGPVRFVPLVGEQGWQEP